MASFNGVQVFSATMQRDREALGDQVTTWITELERAGGELVECQVLQSSDNEFHCITIVAFYSSKAPVTRSMASSRNSRPMQAPR